MSTTPASASTSSAPVFIGNIATGRTLLKDSSGNCFTCHQDADEDGYFEAGAVNVRINVNTFTYPQNTKYADDNYTGQSVEDLARYIEEQMPLNPAGCVDQCAQDIAAYLWSLRGQKVVIGPQQCTSEDPVLYGRRALKFLTSYEYHNSLQALFEQPLPADYSASNKIVGDNTVGGLPNHAHSKIGENRVNSYDSNAADIANWALNTSGALSFECKTATQCTQDFTEKFAYYAFRRPLTVAEKNEYSAIINEATNLEIGLKWAIRSALMSPQFLYREELGRTAAQALIDINKTPERIIYEPAAEPTIITGNSPANSGYTFTGNDLLIMTFTATSPLDYSVSPPIESGLYPAIRITGNGYNSEPVPMNGPGPVTLQFHVSTLTGPVYFLAPQGVGEINGVKYGGNFNMTEFLIAPAKVKEIPETYKQKVTAAEPNSYVLDSFEYASALSYLLTASSPDKALMKAALIGDLENPLNVEKHIDRLMDSSLGRAQVERFAGLWFGTDQVRNVNRFGNDNFTRDVKNAMAQEIRTLFAHAFYDKDVAYRELLEADFTFLNKTLSEFYGITGANSDEFVKVSTAGTPRGGLVASGAFMALNAHDDRTSPIKRAVHLRQDFLCQSIPQPEALDDGDERIAAVDLAKSREQAGDLTTTEFYDIQTNVPGTGCAVCHNAVINPLFAIDDFDNVGLPRSVVDGQIVQTGLGPNGAANVPIQAVNTGGFLFSGHALGAIDTQAADNAKTQGNGIAFSGAKALSKALVHNNLPGVDACLIQKTYRYALGTPITQSDVDTRFEASLNTAEQGQMLCMQDALNRALGSANDPKAMLKALSLSDVVRFRR
ncbi:DUF1592 domain-containing protein [Marinagarivorans algicola]|uniref:DUF1592 domain-containing protein n=1 Tax=Marinagarivorans algicola TaxID=1513270 RepID=UPI00138EF925|nr:DUF1592 domain-containing protein [Marinagarivorans algicola]